MKIFGCSPRHSTRDHCRRATLNGDLCSSVLEGQAKLRSASNIFRNIGKGTLDTKDTLQLLTRGVTRYWAIFWVDASSNDRIQQCFTQLARLLQVDVNVDSVKRKLANTSQSWLLVFDNADDPNLNLAPYLPAGNRGDIIITSRNPQHQHYSTVGFKEVARLSLHDSILLLTKVVYGEIHILPHTSEERKKFVKVLGCHALAIVQAGYYIRETSCSLSDYLEIYQRRKRVLLGHLPTHLGTDYQNSVYATWQISVDTIESRQDTVSYSTLCLLNLLGFYHHDQIPVQMLYNAWRNLQSNQDLPDYLPWRDAVLDFVDYRQSVQASITLLASFSLVTRNANASFSLHPLVHAWCRDRMGEDEQEWSFRRALSLLTGSVRWRFESEDYTFRRSLVSHVYEFLRLRDQYGDLGEEMKMQKWPVLALVLGENGWTRDAIRLTEELVELQESRLGADHPDTSLSMHNLAIQYSEAGRRAEALQLTEEVVQLQKSRLGADHPDTLLSMHNLANRYSEAGRRAEALQLTEEVVQLLKSRLGPEYPDTLGSMHNLAIRYSEAGRRAEALQLTEEVVQLRKSRLGEDHPDTLTSMHNLANRYSEAGRRAEALQLTEEAVQLLKSKLGADHPDTLRSMHNLAIRYSEAGRRAEALQLTEEVVQLLKSKLGADHPDTLRSMHNLAIQYSEAGRRAEALQLTEEVVQLRKSKLGADHPDTLTSMHNLANRYSEAGRRAEALQLTEEVVQLRKSKLGEDYLHTVESMHEHDLHYDAASREREPSGVDTFNRHAARAAPKAPVSVLASTAQDSGYGTLESAAANALNAKMTDDTASILSVTESVMAAQSLATDAKVALADSFAALLTSELVTCLEDPDVDIDPVFGTMPTLLRNFSAELSTETTHKNVFFQRSIAAFVRLNRS
jgi:tetratricopeptide (TPR) repeat protein